MLVQYNDPAGRSPGALESHRVEKLPEELFGAVGHVLFAMVFSPAQSEELLEVEEEPVELIQSPLCLRLERQPNHLYASNHL